MSRSDRTNSLPASSFWFVDGLWWFRPHRGEEALEISSLMRSTCYNAEALARALRLGDRTFRRMVTESFGVSPGVWLRKERAVAIRHQLREGARIKQLASHYGFKNPCDFSAEFKRWYQVSPSTFVADARHRAMLDNDGSTRADTNFGQETIAFDLPWHDMPG